MLRFSPLLILAACAPVLEHQDCTDLAIYRSTCESRNTEPKSKPEPEPEEPGGHWATRDNEPDSRTDPEGHRDWQRDRDRQIEDGTW